MISDFLSLTEIAFIAIIVIPALLGLINMLKRVGLAVDFAGPVAVVLGVVVMLTYAAFGDNRYFIFAMLGILVGLGVTGFYDLSKQFGTPAIPPAEIVVPDDWAPGEPAEGVFIGDPVESYEDQDPAK